MMKHEPRREFEPLFDPEDITNEIAITRTLVEERFSHKLKIISALIETQTKLVGIYYKQLAIKDKLNAEYRNNSILNNTLINFPYRALSTLLLTRHTFYGSARIVCRQLFESSIIAKYSEYDPTLITKWKLQGEENQAPDPKNEISIFPDVFMKLRTTGRGTTGLRELWKTLCAVSHATQFSQQDLRTSSPEHKEDVIAELSQIHFFEMTENTLDLLLTLAVMNFHLVLGHLCRKANRWYLGYLRDPSGSYEHERQLKQECKTLIREYFHIDRARPERTTMWKKSIFEFKQSWGPRA